MKQPPLPPLARYAPDLYAFWWQASGVQITLDRLHESRDNDLVAQIEVRRGDEHVQNLVHQAKINLNSTRVRAEVVRALDQRFVADDLDWGAHIEQVAFLALKHWREGDPLIDLAELGPSEKPRFLLSPYVEYGGPTVVFAEGGSGKSLFSLAVAFTVATGVPVLGLTPTTSCPVLYLDWESDAATHAARLRSLAAGVNKPVPTGRIFYRQQAASLAESAPHLRRLIAEQQIGFIVVDSLGAARGGEPESADTTLRLFGAARTLGVPWLGVDHVAKALGAKATTPFGSVFTVNQARLTWGMEKVAQTETGESTLVLTNHKANNGGEGKQMAYTVTIRADADEVMAHAHYQKTDVRRIPEMLPRLGLSAQIQSVLTQGALTVREITLALEADDVTVPEQSVRNTLNRRKDSFVTVIGEDGAQRWGLLSRR